jgi:hypothetical protein
MQAQEEAIVLGRIQMALHQKRNSVAVLIHHCVADSS